jgi:hypothetical protein
MVSSLLVSALVQNIQCDGHVIPEILWSLLVLEWSLCSLYYTWWLYRFWSGLSGYAGWLYRFWDLCSLMSVYHVFVRFSDLSSLMSVYHVFVRLYRFSGLSATTKFYKFWEIFNVLITGLWVLWSVFWFSDANFSNLRIAQVSYHNVITWELCSLLSAWSLYTGFSGSLFSFSGSMLDHSIYDGSMYFSVLDHSIIGLQETWLQDRL